MLIARPVAPTAKVMERHPTTNTSETRHDSSSVLICQKFDHVQYNTKVIDGCRTLSDPPGTQPLVITWAFTGGEKKKKNADSCQGQKTKIKNMNPVEQQSNETGIRTHHPSTKRRWGSNIGWGRIRVTHHLFVLQFPRAQNWLRAFPHQV